MTPKPEMALQLAIRDSSLDMIPTGLFVSAPGLSVIMWLGVVLAAGLTALRTLYQYRTNRRLLANDIFILSAFVFHLATAIVFQVMIPPLYETERVGHGLEAMTASFVPSADLFLRLQFAADLLLWTTTWLVKASLLSFFWLLFDSVQTPMRIFWYIMCFLTAGTYVCSVVLQMFACDPLSKLFHIGGCTSASDIFHSNLVFQFSAGTDIGIDVLVMLIPFPLLWKLHVNKKQRNILVVIFCLPIIPITFAILRLAATNPTDTFVDPIRFLLFSMLEASAAISTASLPALRLFLTKSNSSTSSRSYGRSHRHPSAREFSDSLHGSKGRIPLQTVVKSEKGTLAVSHSDESQEEIWGRGKWSGVRVDHEIVVE